MRFPRATYANVMATLAALVAAGSLTGIARSEAPSNEINACVDTQSGALRIVGSLANCDRATESALSWNQQGVAGAQGPPVRGRVGQRVSRTVKQRGRALKENTGRDPHKARGR